jgi:hypothetical protein
MPSQDREIPRLCDPTRQTAARGAKSGRFARDDRRKKRRAQKARPLEGHKGAAPGNDGHQTTVPFCTVHLRIDLLRSDVSRRQPPETPGRPMHRARGGGNHGNGGNTHESSRTYHHGSSTPSCRKQCSCLCTARAAGEGAGQTATRTATSAGETRTATASAAAKGAGETRSATASADGQ